MLRLLAVLAFIGILLGALGGLAAHLSVEAGSLGVWILPANVPTPSLIPATVDIHPEKLHLRSQGEDITARIELPPPYRAADIDIATVRLKLDSAEVPADEDPVGGGPNHLVVKFDRAAVIAMISNSGQTGAVTLTVTGQLHSGTSFAGSDTIVVMASPGLEPPSYAPPAKVGPPSPIEPPLSPPHQRPTPTPTATPRPKKTPSPTRPTKG